MLKERDRNLRLLQMTIDDDVLECIEEYFDALEEYENSPHQPSYSVIEIPKIKIADALLRALYLPTAPDPISIVSNPKNRRRGK